MSKRRQGRVCWFSHNTSCKLGVRRLFGTNTSRWEEPASLSLNVIPPQLNRLHGRRMFSLEISLAQWDSCKPGYYREIGPSFQSYLCEMRCDLSLKPYSWGKCECVYVILGIHLDVLSFLLPWSTFSILKSKQMMLQDRNKCCICVFLVVVQVKGIYFY